MEYRLVSRKEEIGTLLEIISKKELYQENSKNGLVILLNGGWGTGKTTFLEEFIQEIENNDEVELFNNYNAYEHDFYEDAYTPFFASLNDKIQLEDEAKGFIKTIGKDISKGTIATVIALLKGLAKKAGVDFNDINSEIENFDGEKNYDDYIERYKDFMKFKNVLKEKIATKTSNKKQIFIIDELDRCKPTFAAETLEIVKHFFDIENCIFIISVDKEQLEESTKTIFGQGIKAEKYFSKLFDYQFNLLPLKYKDLIDSTNGNEAKFISLAQEIFDALSISTRDGKKIMNDFINRTTITNVRVKAFLLFMIVLKYTDLSFCKAILNGDYENYRELIKGEYNNGYSHYLNAIEIMPFDNKTYDFLLQEVSLCANVSVDSFDGSEDIATINGKSMTRRQILDDIEIFIPVINEWLTVRENIEKVVG